MQHSTDVGLQTFEQFGALYILCNVHKPIKKLGHLETGLFDKEIILPFVRHLVDDTKNN